MRRLISLFGIFLSILYFSKIGIIKAAGVFAYIAHSPSGKVFVIDTSTDSKVIENIVAGVASYGVAVTPDGKKVYVTNNKGAGFSTVSVIDASTNIEIGDIDVYASPTGIAITPDRKKVYVANNNSGAISVIDTKNDQVIKIISSAVGDDPFGIAITPDGGKAYVTNNRAGTLSIIDTTSDKLIGTDILIGSKPYGIAITPDGSKAYITHNSTDTMDPATDTISVIDTSTDKVATTIKLLAKSTPTGIAITPDGNKAYVANQDSNSVSVIDIKSNKKVGGNIPVGNGPLGVSITPDGKKVYVANINSGKVSVIDTTNDAEITKIDVGISPISLGNFITPFAITSPLTATGRVDEPFNCTLTAVSYRPLQLLTADSLSSGLKFNFNSESKIGLISGTPTSAGVFRINLGASNDKVNISETLVLTVVPSAIPAISSPLTATGKVGQPFTYTFTVTGDQPITFTASPLPKGLSFDPSTGVISGTPTEDGTFNINLNASNRVGSTNKTLVLTIAKANPSQSENSSNGGGGCSLIQPNLDNKIASFLFLLSMSWIVFRRKRLKV